MIEFENVKIIQRGIHEPVGDKMRIGSTVTLIKSDKLVLVDTGGFGEQWDSIKSNLDKENIRPEDIDVVILTHLHIDHTANANKFRNARVCMKFRPNSGQFQEVSEGTLKKIDIEDGTEIANGVSIILTPGHTEDMISVLVETTKGKIVVAGDAIPKEEWIDLSKKPDSNLVHDVQKFDESRNKILRVANWVIPGHGDIFEVKK